MARFDVIDFLEADNAGVVGADGTCEIVFSELDPANHLRVERIVVQCDSALQSTALIYVGDTTARSLREATELGNVDIADNAQPILVPPGRAFIVRWEGATPGAAATAHIQYAVLEKVLDTRSLY